MKRSSSSRNESLGVEREQRVGVGAALVPDDARPAARQRQDGERAGGQEMLLGAALVIALVGDRGDDAGLVVVPADGRDVGERGERRTGAVGGDGEAGAQRRPSVKRHFADVLPGVQRGDRRRRGARRRAGSQSGGERRGRHRR